MKSNKQKLIYAMIIFIGVVLFSLVLNLTKTKNTFLLPAGTALYVYIISLYFNKKRNGNIQKND